MVLESLNHPRDRTRWEGAMGYQGLLRQVLLRLVGCSWFSRWQWGNAAIGLPVIWLVTHSQRKRGPVFSVQGVSFCGTSRTSNCCERRSETSKDIDFVGRSEAETP